MVEEKISITDGEEDWNVANYFRSVIQGWRFLAGCAGCGLALALFAALAIKPWYVAEAVFLPPKPEVSPAEPFAALLGANDASDSYLGMLTSRTVADEVVDRLNLAAVYKAKLKTDARTQLAKNSKFTVNKNSLISVSVTDSDPSLAAAIANAYLESLYRLNGEMVRSASDHRRAFFEEQLATQKAALAAAESDLKLAQQKTGVLLPANQAQANLSANAQLQAQIGAVETRLAGLLSGATEQNPQVVEARSQLRQLESQLANQQATNSQHIGGLATTRQLPELVLENLEKEREVKLRETVYDALVSQYEKARLSALDPGPQLQIVDHAIAPERKAGPPRTLMVISGSLLGFLFGVAWLLLRSNVRHSGAESKKTQVVRKS